MGLASAAGFAQDTASTAPKPKPPAAPYASRFDVFMGYSYLSPHGTVNVPTGGTPAYVPVKPSSVDVGAIGSGTYFFNRYVGGQIEVGAHPDGKNDTFLPTAQGGIVFRYPTGTMTPWVHGLAGAVRAQGPLHQTFTWGPALTVGGGMDYDLPFWGHHLGLRLFQADYEYMHVNFGPQPPPQFGGRANYDVARLSTGLLLHMGSIVPPPPVTLACTASPASVFPGDPVTVTGTAGNLNPKKTPTYTFTGAGVKADNSTATVDTHDQAPGEYTVKGNVTEGPKAGQSADCSATYTVKQFEPPTVSCSANPTTVKPGDSATITANGVSPQNRPLTYSYSSTSGSVSGSGNTATLTTSGAPAGSITVTCTVTDDKGQTASSTTSVNVEAPPPPPAPKTKQLCSINFDRDKRRPARVDNEAKACLDDVALNLQQQSDATAVVVGNSAPKERNGSKLAAQRAVNTKDYLVKEKGIDSSRITVATGSDGEKKADNYLVPSGASFSSDVSGTTPVNESTVRPQARSHAAARHKKAAK